MDGAPQGLARRQIQCVGGDTVGAQADQLVQRDKVTILICFDVILDSMGRAGEDLGLAIGADLPRGKGGVHGRQSDLVLGR